MKQIIALAVLGALAASGSARADDKKYTLADLRSLVAQRSYSEAISHLGDIGPSERNADWLDTAATAAGGYLASLSNDNLVTKVLAIEELDERFPPLLKSAKYTRPRAEIGLKAYTACFENDYATQECFEHALKFVDADPANSELAFKMGKIVRKNAFHYVAIPYFKRALAGKGGAMCKDDDLSLAVVSGLGLPKGDDKAADARAIAAGACFADLKKAILAAFTEETAGGSVHDNACDLLNAKKALTADQAKTCK